MGVLPVSTFHSRKHRWGLGLRFRVWGLGFGVWGLGFGVWSSRFGDFVLIAYGFCADRLG